MSRERLRLVLWYAYGEPVDLVGHLVLGRLPVSPTRGSES